MHANPHSPLASCLTPPARSISASLPPEAFPHAPTSGPEARSIPAWGEAPGKQRTATQSAGSPIYRACAKLALLSAFTAHAAPPACRQATIEGELEAGKPWSQPIGNGLKLYFQPIHSGWIARVLPLTGPLPAHDFAELATPPYQSVTPLSLSTDFAFRAQDAVGWNPRRFRFAASLPEFQRLDAAYQAYQRALPSPSGEIQSRLAAQVARAPEATLTILDTRLTPGTADQWFIAASVASHFLTTAHTLVPPALGASTPLGRLLWVRFRVTFVLPPKFLPAPGLKILPRVCGIS